MRTCLAARSIVALAAAATLAGCLSQSGSTNGTTSAGGSNQSAGAGTATSNATPITTPTTTPSPTPVPSTGPATPQPAGTTADEFVSPYDGLFAYGSNMGYYNWADNDRQLGSLLVGGANGQAGIGVKSMRPALFDKYVQMYGITSRAAEFAHYKQLGAIDLTLFLGQWYWIDKGCRGGAAMNWDNAGAKWRCVNPASRAFDDSLEYDRRDPKSYGGCNQRSWMHANLYKPIWISASDGSKRVNPDNYLAEYVAGVVATYKQYGIKFYEVWNEPDYTDNWQVAQDPSHADYWGRSNPKPCDLSRTTAPISHHVRLHRVVYEVVKTLDPTAFVATGGLGYSSYLDALMRNTDNPGTQFEQNAGEGVGTAEGAIDSARYPKKGGAYFDVLSFHAYPQYALSRWAGSAACNAGERKQNERCYNEHSDAAMSAFFALRDDFNSVLVRYGYDGVAKPAKHWINTEFNVPRIPARQPQGSALANEIQYWGAEDYARNFLVKAMVLAQKHNVRQMYIYQPSDEYNEDGTDCNGLMGPIGTMYHALQGLFKNLNCTTPAAAVPTVQATAMKTISGLLFGWRYDAARTAALNLPSGTDGAAFRASDGRFRYVLWAKTTADRNESGAITYALPASVATGTLRRYAWDWSTTAATGTMPANALRLEGAPAVFELP